MSSVGLEHGVSPRDSGFTLSLLPTKHHRGPPVGLLSGLSAPFFLQSCVVVFHLPGRLYQRGMKRSVKHHAVSPTDPSLGLRLLCSDVIKSAMEFDKVCRDAAAHVSLHRRA